MLIREGAVPDQLPWPEFGGVTGLAGIVLRNPPLQILCGADVFLLRKFDAAKDVDVLH
jgi:hypothetical protein